MKILSHAHINGNGTKYRNEYARILATAARKRKYTHIVVGCHGSYIASKQTMDEVRKKKIIPIRFTEVGMNVKGNSHSHSHVALLNIPEEPLPKHKHDEGDISNFMPYIKKTRCKLVLCHPRDLAEIKAWAPYIDGYEIMNGLDRYQRRWKNRDASAYFPNKIQFIGADYHVWEGMGDLDYFTELPDGWFGKLYE